MKINNIGECQKKKKLLVYSINHNIGPLLIHTMMVMMMVIYNMGHGLMSIERKM